MSDQPQNQSSEEKPKSYDKMPEMDEFNTLDSATQKDLLWKFPLKDQEEEESKPSEGESEQDQPKEDVKGEESTQEDKPDKEPVKDEESEMAKNYKSLQAEFTRRSQELSELKKEFKAFSKADESKETEETSPLDDLAKDNPKAKELIDAIRADVESKLKQGIQPIQEKLTQRQATENYGTFQTEVKEFLSSSLGRLEPEFNAVVNEYYENQDALVEDAAKDPALFSKLKKEVLARNFEKAAELVKEKPTLEAKNKIVKETGVSGKATTTTEIGDDLDLKTFGKKTSTEMKAALRKVGAVKN